MAKLSSPAMSTISYTLLALPSVESSSSPVEASPDSRGRRRLASQAPREQEPGFVDTARRQASCIPDLERAGNEIAEQRVEAERRTERRAQIALGIEVGVERCAGVAQDR